MLGMVVLVGMGERLAERFLPLYLLALGGSNWAIGALNGLNNLLGALYSLPGGYLSDRLGYRRALLLFNLMAIAGYAVVLAIPTWWAVLAGAVLFIAWSAIAMPAIMSMVATLVPAKHRTVGVSLHSLIRRLPMAVGPILGGLLIARYGTIDGVRIAIAGALAMAIVAALLVGFRIAAPPAPAARPPSVRVRLDPALRHLLVTDILIRFAEQIPYAFVVVWVVKLHGFSPTTFGVLTAVEMATAAVCYLPVAALADRSGKKGVVLITCGFFTLFPALLYFSTTLGALYAAFVVRGLKEFGEPARKAMILDLAPPESRATTFGTYYLIRDTVVSVAAFGGAWLWNLGPGVNLATAAACGLIGTLYFARFGSSLPRPPETA